MQDQLVAATKPYGVADNCFVVVLETRDALHFDLNSHSYGALHCNNESCDWWQEMLDWSAQRMTTVLKFCNTSGANLHFTSSSAMFPDRGG